MTTDPLGIVTSTLCDGMTTDERMAAYWASVAFDCEVDRYLADFHWFRVNHYASPRISANAGHSQ